MDIQEAAFKTSISPDKIRYWERVGMIPPVKRDSRGIRHFNDPDIKWLELAKTVDTMDVSKDFQIEYVKLAQLGKKANPARVTLVNEQLSELTQQRKKLVSELNRIENLITKHQAS